MSVLSPTESPLLKVEVRSPRPSGVAATIAIPSSRQVASASVPSGPSISRENREYSGWYAATGAIFVARRMVLDVTVERPMCLILPSLMIDINFGVHNKRLRNDTYA